MGTADRLTVVGKRLAEIRQETDRLLSVNRGDTAAMVRSCRQMIQLIAEVDRITVEVRS